MRHGQREPQSYFADQGPAKWELSQHKGGLHGDTIVGNDKEGRRAAAARSSDSVPSTRAVEPDQGNPVISVSGRDPQSVFTPIVQKIKENKSTWNLNIASANQALLIRNEADAQGVDRSRSSGSARSVLRQFDHDPERPGLLEGEYQFLGFLPFEEASVNKTLQGFLTNEKKVGGTPDQFGAYGFAAVIAFRDAVNSAVKAHGVNGITRTNLITATKGLTNFDADGMLGTRSFKTGQTTSCFMVVKFTNGKWVRQYPTKKGTFDCKPSNAVTITANLINGT